VHLLKVMLEDPEGLCMALIRKAGGDGFSLQKSIDKLLSEIATVSGSNSQMYMDDDTIKAIEEAERLSIEFGDSFVSTEIL
jgi:ATP-dependent Clp protease ATP-binding subunit ClpB